MSKLKSMASLGNGAITHEECARQWRESEKTGTYTIDPLVMLDYLIAREKRKVPKHQRLKLVHSKPDNPPLVLTPTDPGTDPKPRKARRKAKAKNTQPAEQLKLF